MPCRFVGPGAFRRSALEGDVDALLVQRALALDIAQALGDKASIRSDIWQSRHSMAPSLSSAHAIRVRRPLRQGGRAGPWRSPPGRPSRSAGSRAATSSWTTKRRRAATARSPRREDVCVVADLQSANGTFVNEKRIATVELQRGDKIRIGSTVIELLDADAPRSRRARPAQHDLAQHRRIAQQHAGAARRRSHQARVPVAGLQAQGRSAPARIGAEVPDDAAQGVGDPVARVERRSAV